MRSKDRINPFLYEIGTIWKESFCDIRFGQLICNFFSWIASEKKIDPFYIEEGKMLELFTEYRDSIYNEDKKVSD